jgi:hypothetical protein
MNQEEEEEEGNKNICAICLKSMTGGDVKRVVALFPCGHLYDEICWSEWAAKTKTGNVTTCCICNQSAQHVARLFIDLSSEAPTPTPCSVCHRNDATGPPVRRASSRDAVIS